NSIQNTMTVANNSLSMFGIKDTAITNTTGVNVSNNIVRNLTNGSTNLNASIVRGIQHSGSAGLTANNNAINDLNCATTQAGATSTPQVVGIMTSSGALN